MSRARAVALAALLVVSIFAGVVPLSQQATAQQGTTGPPAFVDVPSQNTQKSPEVVNPGNPPQHALSSTSPQKNGPPAYVEELLQKVPAKALSNTRVSKHANTTMVDYAATETGSLAVVVTDEVSSDGRTVAIGANVLYRTLDKAPKFATVRHESGETSVETINYSDGYAHISIEGFSTNAVTFSGQVHLTGDPAVDGTSYQYGLQDLDAVGSYSINVTGNTAYERENQSGQVGDGETIPLSIAGTADPVGPEGQAVPQVVLEGTETTSLFSLSGGPVTGGASATATLGGNQAPRNAAITFEGNRSENARTVSATAVSDGATQSYSVGGNLPAEGEEVTFIGNSDTTSRTVSQTGVGDGSGHTYDVGGNLAAENEQVTFTGRETSTQDDYGGSGLSPSATESISVDGNLQPTDGSGNDPLLEVTGHSSSYDVSGATYDGYVIDSEPFTTVNFYNNGNDVQLFKVKTASDPQAAIHRYSLSTAYDLSTATYQESWTDVYSGLSGDGSRKTALYSPDGTKIFAADSQLNTIEQFSLSTAYDPSTMTHGGNFSTSGITSESEPAFSPDGTKMYIADQYAFDNDVREYTLSTAWDVTTASEVNTMSANNNGNSAIEFNDDGTVMLLLSTDSMEVEKYELSTAWDISTASSVSTMPLDDGEVTPYGLQIGDGGKKMYVGDQDTNEPAGGIYQYTVGSDVSGLSVTDNNGNSHSFGDLSDGETKSTNLNLDTSSSQLDFSASGGSSIDYDLTMVEHTATEDPSLDVDGDGTDEASYSGILTSGQTHTDTVDGLQGGSSYTASTSLTTHTVDWDLTFDEKTATEDPALDIDGDGTNEASYSGVLTSGQTHTESVDGLQDGQSYTAETSLAGATVDWDLTFTEPTAVEDPGVDVDGDGTEDASYLGTLDQGESSTKSISDGLLTTGSNTLAFSGTGEVYNYTLNATEVYHTEDPDVDVDGDGTYEVTYTGILSPGSTATYDASELTLQSDQMAIVTNSGSEVIAEAQYRERTQTQDVAVSVNGNPTSYDLTLDDGETTSLAVNESWLVNGTNEVEISVAPSTGSDAPDGQVGLDYFHTAEDVVETSYEGETWTERYNVSKTWANSKENATLTIPFNSDKVVGIRGIEKSINDSSPTAVEPANYSLKDTTLTVEFGDVQEGEKTTVWANGTKVNVGNGDITVTDPTIEGNALDTGFRIDRHDPGFYLELSGTATPDRVHHLETLSWTAADPYTEHNADGTQFLYLPNATDGGEATMQTLPLEVDPKTGDVHIALEDDNESHPIFEVTSGDQLGDEVGFVWHNTTSGETYVLTSRTNDIARDTQVAESPVTLLDDDSPEVLEIYEEDQQATDDGGSSSGGTQYISPVESTRAWYESLPVISIGAALALAVVAAIANYLFREWYEILGTVGAAALVELVLLTEFVWPEVILSPLATGIREIAPTIAFILAVTIAYVIYKRWGTITDSGDEDAVTVSDNGVLRLRRK